MEYSMPTIWKSWENRRNVLQDISQVLIYWRNNTMKNITDSLIQKLNLSHCGLAKFSWNELYDTEDELIHDMFNDKIHTEGLSTCRGYGYIKSFRAYYNIHNNFTEKQIRQFKRLAGEIAYNIYAKQ